MAKIRNKKTSKFNLPQVFNNYWKKENYIILGLGVALIILGNYLLSIEPWDSFESLTLAPIVLLVAYLVVLPLSLFYKKKNKETEEKQNAAG